MLYLQGMEIAVVMAPRQSCIAAVWDKWGLSNWKNYGQYMVEL